MGKGDLAAAYAIDCAEHPEGNEFKELSGKMCWEAVVLCAFRAGAIDKDTCDRIGSITTKDYDLFMMSSCPNVCDAVAMRKVPPGSFLGFIVRQPEAQNGNLVHAMIATGDGWAAGNKNNAATGLGSEAGIGWEKLDLAGGLNWQPGGYFVDPGGRQIEIRYRVL